MKWITFQISPSARDLLEGLLLEDADQRRDIKFCIGHSWLSEDSNDDINLEETSQINTIHKNPDSENT